MPTRWIEEAEARRLRERAALEPDTGSPRAVAPIAAAVHLLRMYILRSKPIPQTDRDGRTGGSLSCLGRNSGI
jgi:hypothetical protein